ncbi:nuclear transport factor 2 family protein [Spongiibacter sp.]|uniref:nuclear transport factor 2 family protein n=1 Tax=Spongiibacter sp. TaxID=2024860 RepID=UPI0035622B62
MADSQQSERHRRVAIDFIERLSAGDTEGFLALYHPEAMLWTSGNTLISGHYNLQQIASSAVGVLDAFPDGLRFTVHATTAEGDRVAMEAESCGLHSSGQQYRNYYHFLFRFKDGLIVELKEYMDTEVVTDILCGGQRPTR